MLVVNISILVNNLDLLMSNWPKRERSFIYSDECWHETNREEIFMNMIILMVFLKCEIKPLVLASSILITAKYVLFLSFSQRIQPPFFSFSRTIDFKIMCIIDLGLFILSISTIYFTSFLAIITRLSRHFFIREPKVIVNTLL